MISTIFFIVWLDETFFSDTPWVETLMYFAGILLILLGALLVNAITGYKFRKSFLGTGFLPGLIAVLALVVVVVCLIYRTNKLFKEKYELKKAV